MVKKIPAVLLGLLISFGAWAAILGGSNDTTGWTTDSGANSNAGETWNCQQLTASQTGTATSIGLYATDAAATNFKFILTNSSGTVLATSGVLNPTATPAWVVYSGISVAITSGQNYYTCAIADTGYVGYRSNTSMGNYTADDGSYAAPPSSLTFSANGGNTVALWYIDGTVSGGGVTKVRLMDNLGKAVGPHASQELGGLLQGQ